MPPCIRQGCRRRGGSVVVEGTIVDGAEEWGGRVSVRSEVDVIKGRNMWACCHCLWEGEVECASDDGFDSRGERGITQADDCFFFLEVGDRRKSDKSNFGCDVVFWDGGMSQGRCKLHDKGVCGCGKEGVESDVDMGGVGTGLGQSAI